MEVAIVMGSMSDWSVMEPARDVLKSFGVQYYAAVVSAHRGPHAMYEFATEVAGKGIKVVIAGAGGAAHLPGMIAALTTVPVIGVPVLSSNSLAGWDSLLSIVQMPNDVPVATVAVNGAHNAGMLAIQMLAISDPALAEQLQVKKTQLADKVRLQNEELQKCITN